MKMSLWMLKEILMKNTNGPDSVEFGPARSWKADSPVLSNFIKFFFKSLTN